MDPATPAPEQFPSLWQMLAPVALGLGSFATGFGVGRNPHGDPGIFQEPLKTLAAMQHQQALLNHSQTQQQYQQSELEIQRARQRAQEHYQGLEGAAKLTEVGLKQEEAERARALWPVFQWTMTHPNEPFPGTFPSSGPDPHSTEGLANPFSSPLPPFPSSRPEAIPSAQEEHATALPPLPLPRRKTEMHFAEGKPFLKTSEESDDEWVKLQRVKEQLLNQNPTDPRIQGLESRQRELEGRRPPPIQGLNEYINSLSPSHPDRAHAEKYRDRLELVGSEQVMMMDIPGVGQVPVSVNTKTREITNLSTGQPVESVPRGGTLERPRTSTGVHITPEGIELEAQNYLARLKTDPNGKVELPLSVVRAGISGPVLQRVSDLLKAEGNDPLSARIGAMVKGADQKSLAGVTRQLDMVTAFENTVKKNMILAQQAVQAAPRTFIPKLDQLYLAVEVGAGNTEAPLVYAGILPIVAEYAKILEGNISASGASVESRRESARILSPYFTPGQIGKLFPFMTQEMENRTSQLTGQRQEIIRRLQHGSSGPSFSPSLERSSSAPKVGSPTASPTRPMTFEEWKKAHGY